MTPAPASSAPFLRRLLERELIGSLGIMGLRVSMLGAKFVLALFIVRYIGLEAMGVFGLVSGACAVVPMVMRAGIFSNIARQAVNKPLSALTIDFRHYGTGVALLYAVLALPLSIAAGIYFGAPELALLCLIVIFFEHAGNDIFVITNNLGRPKLANAVLSAQASLWIVIYMALAFFVPSFRTIDWVFAFWAIGGAVMTVSMLLATKGWPWREAFSLPLQKNWYKTHAAGSWRIYISEIVSSSTIYLDRYLIGIFLSIEMVGVYVLFWQVTNAICNLVGAGVLQVYTPRLVLAHKEKDDARFHALFGQSAKKSLAATAGLAVLSGAVVPFLVGFTDNSVALDYLPLLWLMLAALMFRTGADIYAYALYARHRDDLVFVSTILKLCVTALGTVLFIHLFGVYGVVPSAAATGAAAIAYAMVAWKGKKAL